MRSLAMVVISFFFVLLCCQNSIMNENHILVITSDFNSVRRCSTLNELNQVAQTMISARPDIMAMDAASPDLVNYQSEIGFFVPGTPFDALMQKGYDPYAIMVDTLRNHDIIVMANIRMNDHHGRLIYWTPWERQHRDWSLAEDTGARNWKSIGALRHMDYAIKGVRDYRFSIIEEIVERFNIDGIQLDFGRTAPFVSEPKTENGKFMTDYIRRIRELLDKTSEEKNRGKMFLGAILPWDYEFCLQEGLQVETWIKAGLVDYISPGEWYYADWNLPLKKWKDITTLSECKLYPFTPGNVSPYQSFEYGEKSLLSENHVLDPPKIRAIADNFMFQKPDGFAFYNFYTFDYGPYYPKLRTWTNPAKTRHLSKHYLNCRKLLYHADERRTFDIGIAFQRYPMTRMGDKTSITFRFSSDIGSSPALFQCVFKHATEQDVIAVKLNNILLEPDSIRPKIVKPDSGEAFSALFWQSEISMPPLKMGENYIEFELKRHLSNTTAIKVGEFEILVEPGV